MLKPDYITFNLSQEHHRRVDKMVSG